MIDMNGIGRYVDRLHAFVSPAGNKGLDVAPFKVDPSVVEGATMWCVAKLSKHRVGFN